MLLKRTIFRAFEKTIRVTFIDVRVGKFGDLPPPPYGIKKAILFSHSTFFLCDFWFYFITPPLI